MPSRREFLKLGATFIGGLVIGGASGYALAPKQVVTQPTTQTSQIQTSTPAQTIRKLKAAWIYVGPVGDLGWSHAHDVGKRATEGAFPWLETDYAESIDESKCLGAIESFIRKGYKLIFTTSFDHMNPTYQAAEKYPDIIFFHCSGYKRRANMGTYFADLYQVYYINGIMAGALTKTGNLGYVAAHLIPEVIRHINAFTIGAMEVNPNIRVYVIELGSWVAPEKAEKAADTMVRKFDVDVLAFTEDTPQTVKYCQKLYEDEGKLVPVFGHYSPMYKFGKDVVVSGQVVRWEVIYKDIVAKVYAGLYTNKNLADVDYWYLLNSGAVDVGSTSYYDEFWVNDKFIPILKSKKVVDKITGVKMSALDLAKLRYSQMKDRNLTFDPFTGPLEGVWWSKNPGKVLGKTYNEGETVKVPRGARLGHDDLWSMGWFLKNVTVYAP